MMKRVRMQGALLASVLIALAAGCVKPQPTERETEEATPEKSGWEVVFEEGFDAPEWRSQFTGSDKAWTVVDGSLRGSNDKNAGLWWKGDLPREARIEFEATALSDHGDLKVEVFGTRREHQAGYVVIFGGWKNRVSVLARLDEHGKDRIENRSFVPTPNQKHVFLIERLGNVLSVSVDGKALYRLDDSNPIEGGAFGFANWEAPVQFDNLRISKRTSAE